MNRKKNEENELMVKRKDKEIGTMRKKIGNMAKELLEYKNQMNKNRAKQCIMSRTEPRGRK